MTSRDIAASLGYPSVNDYLRAFKRITGMTPSEYGHTVVM